MAFIKAEIVERLYPTHVTKNGVRNTTPILIDKPATAKYRLWAGKSGGKIYFIDIEPLTQGDEVTDFRFEDPLNSVPADVDDFTFFLIVTT